MISSSKPVIAGAALAACIALGACATTPPDNSMADARAAVNRAEANPNVARFDSIDLLTAQQQLANAQKAVEHGSRELADHEAYLAERTAKLAEARGDEAMAQQQVAVTRDERATAQLAASTPEVTSSSSATVHDLQAHIADTDLQQTPRGVMLVLTDNYFDAGLAPLKPSADKIMDGLAQYLLDHPERRVRVEGHMDAADSTASDLGLSLHRAEAVRLALVARGVDPMRSEAVGYGPQSAVASADAGRPLVQGVEIVLSDSRGQIASR